MLIITSGTSLKKLAVLASIQGPGNVIHQQIAFHYFGMQRELAQSSRKGEQVDKQIHVSLQILEDETHKPFH